MGIPSANDRYVSVNVLVEALGTAKTRYVSSPCNGTVRMIIGVMDVVVDGDNAITSSINGTTITGGGFTFAASGAAAGVSQSCAPTGANTVKRGDAIGIITDGGGSAGQANFTILIEQEI